ncbi:hypothetical protein SGLAM104S_00008 [Streptomyces glaucescens]
MLLSWSALGHNVAMSSAATRLDSGLEVAAHRGGISGPNAAHTQEYTRVLEQTDPYYSFVLTDWPSTVSNRSADVVLGLTDRLILCCGHSRGTALRAAEIVEELRASRHGRLVDDMILVVTDTDGSRRGVAPEDVQLGGRMVLIPYDPLVRRDGFQGLRRLRPATTRAFVELAELVVEAGRH